jgi:O-antigen/teichoic acid export membrane protein
MSIVQKAVSGAKWTLGATVCVTLLDLVQFTALAHFLKPEDFGLMAMVIVVLEFTHIYADMGISAALIHKQSIEREVLSSLFWLGIFMGILVFGAVALVSPLIVWLFDEPRIQDLLLLASVVFLITPLGQQFKLLLQKELRFKLISAFDVTATIAGVTTAVFLAYKGRGVYALVYGRLAVALVKAAAFLVVGMARWRPRLRFRVSDLKGFVGFGLYQMGQSSIASITGRLDQILLGMFLGATGLGYYNFAHNIVTKPLTRINPAFVRVAFPVFSKVQDDHEKLRNGYTMILRVLSTINAPIYLGMAITAGEFVPVFFGEMWRPSVMLVQILAFLALLQSLGGPMGVLLLAKGRADLGFKWGLFVACVKVPVVTVCARQWGALGVAVSLIVLQALFWTSAYLFLLRKILGDFFKRYVMSFLPTVLIAAAMALIVLVCAGAFDPGVHLALLTKVSVGVFTYVLLIVAFYRQRIVEMMDLFFKR